MRRVLIAVGILLAVGGFVIIAGGSSNGGGGSTYKVELDNAFGLVNGSAFKVAGVPAGKIQKIDVCKVVKHSGCQHALDALLTVQVSTTGFATFHQDASCESRPQSLIGEYYLNCDPGKSGAVLKSGSTIPVSQTKSTIPADLLNDVMRMPYRERFTLIINELGAAVASRSEDLQEALRRAVPAISQTDNLLNLLANDAQTIKRLNVNSDQVITALANNSAQVQRFIVEAGKAATDSATQQNALRETWAKFPGFLEQLKPAMQKLGAAADANEPVLANLNAASGKLHEFFTDTADCSQPHADNQCGFAAAARPSLVSLGQASVPGKVAVEAATPTVKHLNQFAKRTPELAQNLAIVLHDLDNRSRAVEKDPRSPGGQGYTGLEALLQYVFNQTMAINTFGPFGHLLAVDGFTSLSCSPYATQQSVAQGLQNFGAAYRDCYAWLGPRAPGINTRDPSNPGGCVPDPGGGPPYGHGASDGACKLNPSPIPPLSPDRGANSARAANAGSSGSAPSSPTSGLPPLPGTGGVRIPLPKTPSQLPSPGSLKNALGKVGSAVGGAVSRPAPTNTPSSSSGANSSGGQGTQAQQLLNYLLSP